LSGNARWLAGLAPGPNTTSPHPAHKVYPYLLRGVPVVRPNQVWSTDITHIRLPSGFAYQEANIDWYSQRVLSWPCKSPETLMNRWFAPEIFPMESPRN
jgi:transposase InsO family protein